MLARPSWIALSQNFWLYDSNEWQPDPQGLLQWLAKELQAAEDAGQRAWIMGARCCARLRAAYHDVHAGHISAGKSDCFHEWSAYYNEVRRVSHRSKAGSPA